MLKTLLCSMLLVFFTAASVFAAGYPRQSAVPGGVVKMDLGPAKRAPEVYFDDKRVMVLPNKGSWQAVVGIPLGAKPGTHSIEIKRPGKPQPEKMSFTIKGKKYKEQHLRAKKKYVSPGAKQLARIKREKKEILSMLDKWEDAKVDAVPFELPVKGRLTSPFGLKRFFNKKPRSPHKGIDLAAPLGTPLRSPAPAKVLNVGNYYFNGNTVFLDHGQGLITMYCHLNKTHVKAGDNLKAGQAFGTIGKTGRVTGPHVHWAVYLNGTAVDPSLFLPPKKLTKK